jgi:hypothetical protein
MTDEKTSTAQSKTRVRTTGLVALAVISLLAGASVGASLEEFAAPEYAEDDWMSGVVDDATDDEDWDERESEDSPMKKGAKEFIRGMMSKRMDDRMDDRTEHLEQRVAAGQEFIIALRFCQDNADCLADTDELQEMIDNMESKHTDMQAKIAANSQDELPEEAQMMPVDEDQDEEEVRYDCMTEEVWSDEKQEWCDERADKDDEDAWFDCRTREMWSDEKQEWCDGFMDKENWHQWGDDRKMDYAEDRADMLEAASIAIAYCLESDECDAEASAITSIHQKMMEKHDSHMRCADDMRCDRGKHDRRGLMQRFSDAMFGGPGEIQDREDRGNEVRIMADLEIPQEVCEERGGEWVDDDGTSTCVWPEYDRDCNKDDDSSDDAEEESDRPEESEDDREDDSDSESSSQEECEADGGTWSEERQLCY